MAKLNSTITIGTLVADPEAKTSSTGKAITNLRLAVDGRSKDDTIFVDVTCFDKTAENVAKFKKKGEQIVVEGRLAMDQWEDKSTKQKRSKVYIIANNVSFLSNGKGAEQNVSASPAQESEPEQNSDIPF